MKTYIITFYDTEKDKTVIRKIKADSFLEAIKKLIELSPYISEELDIISIERDKNEI